MKKYEHKVGDDTGNLVLDGKLLRTESKTQKVDKIRPGNIFVRSCQESRTLWNFTCKYRLIPLQDQVQEEI